MNSNQPADDSFDARELRELLWGLRDGVLDAEGAARLDLLVTNHAEARALYVQMTQLFAHLHWYAAAGQGESNPLEAIVAERRGKPVLLSPVSNGGASRTRMLVTLGVATVYYSVFGLLAWGLRPLNAPRDRVRPEMAADDIDSISNVAAVEATFNARWQRGDSAATNLSRPRRGDRLAVGSQWSLIEGAVAIRFDSGAMVNLAAPTDFAIVAANTTRMDFGKLAANVPHQAVGFTVVTPSSTIVDLGTEFGVATNRDGVTHVQVFVGSIQLKPAQLGQTSGSNSDDATVVLQAGDVRRLTPDSIRQSVDVDDVAVEFRGTKPPPVQFPRQISAEPMPGLRRVEHGGAFGKHNLARLPEAKAFALDWFDGRTLGSQYPPHHIENLNDGRYGNQFSWLGKSGDPAFAGIAFGGKHTIGSIAFGRDNGGEELTAKQDYDDLWEGIYTLQYTTTDNPNETTANDEWFTLGTVEYRREDPLVKSGFLQPMIRHRYAFPPVEATGVRILVPGPFGSQQQTIIDEIEVYGEDDKNQP